MFCGTFDSKVDKRGRLNIPLGLGGGICGEILYLKEGADGCVEIHTEVEPYFVENDKLFSVKGEKSKRMIKVPSALFKSNSFYFGKKVTLVGKGSYIRLLPRLH